MKISMLILTLAIGLSAQAKVNDFNNLIVENSKAQNELHTDLKQKLQETRLAVNADSNQRVLVDTSSTINVPTNKSLLVFAKEKSYFRASDQVAQKRLAQELENAE